MGDAYTQNGNDRANLRKMRKKLNLAFRLGGLGKTAWQSGAQRG
jgi:hypothetical protein